MPSDATWNVRDLAPEVRETAREAARRSGLTTAEWLQSVILDSAAQEGVSRSHRPSEPMRREPELPIGSPRLEALDARLDTLSRRIERLAGTGTRTAAPPVMAAATAEGAAGERGRPDRGSSQHLEHALAHLEARLDKLAAEGRSTSNELETRIAAVDRALSALNGGEAASGRSLPDDWWASHATAEYDAHDAQPAMPAPEMRAHSLSAAANDPPDRFRPTLTVQRTGNADTPPPPGERAAASAEPAPASFGLDDAVAEIAARQQALESEDTAGRDRDRQFAQVSTRRTPAPRATEIESDYLSHLQHQLRQLTEQLETLRGPGGFQEALALLRNELADIGRKLTEAAPRRALQALEAEVHTLADRVDVGRHRGGDAATLGNIERALEEVRQALHQLAPAESLAAFREEVRALDRKIDAIAAGGSDAAALRQLENAVAELREIASRAASGDALIALAEEVQTLGDKIDRIVMPAAPGADALGSVDQRLAQLAATLEQRAAAVAPSDNRNLAGIVEALAHKIERMELTRESSPALDQIAAQLGRLSEKVDTSGARLSHLDTIERGLSELYDQLESLHAGAIGAAQRVIKETLEGSGSSGGATYELDSLKHDVGALRQNQVHIDRRTQDTLEALHDTLERLVERLAMVETDMRGDTRTDLHAARAPELNIPAPAQPETRRPAPTAAAPAPVAIMPQERRAIDPTLPADHPLEPGTATPRSRPSGAPTTPAERIAASEAALVGPKPPSEAESKSNFIAAARRAAQAAATMAPPPAGAAAEGSKSSISTLSAIAQKLTRRRPLILGLAILLIAGTLHLVLNVRLTGNTHRADTARSGTQRVVPAPEAAKIGGAPAKPAVSASIVPPTNSSNLPPLGIVASTPSAPLPAISGRELTREPSVSARDAGNGSTPAAETHGATAAPGQDANTVTTVSPLTIASIKLPGGEVTGSIGGGSGFSISNAPPLPGASGASATDRLPAGISPGLRAAALAGDSAAEYEIATGYAEGRGTPINFEHAAHWFERAAERGLAPAQYRLGSLYEKGQGVKKDIEKARRLYTSAADKGNAKAMHNLAVLNAEGIDGKPDFKIAAHWFRKAADRGVADSQYNLAILHARGLGVEQNLAESFKWFALAAQQGDQDAGKKRDDVAARLDQQALVAARLAVQTFTVAPQPEGATTVKAPAGGWDAAAPTTPAKRKGAFPSRRSGPS